MSDSHITLYAQALVSLAEASGLLERIEREMLDLQDLLKSNRDLRNFLGDLSVKHSGKTAALEEILGKRVHPIVTHFLLLLHAEDMLREIDSIAQTFFTLASERRAKASGLLTSAHPISDDVHSRIESEIGRILGKEVHLLVRKDASLLGGMRVQVGDFVVDGTVDRQLAEMRNQLNR